MEKKIKVIIPLSELQTTKPKLRVCAYCRVSTEQEDQNGSYETQKAYYEQYIKSNPEWELAGIYADKGSGTSTKNRDAFNEMLEDCEDNKIDLIICKSISRFARNTLDTIKIARELKDEGIYIIFEKENINTEKTESELAFNLLASFAQMESESISKNVKQGIRNRYKNGEYSISKLTYGYAKKNKSELIINEKEAEVVRLIFKMYIEGYSTGQIVKYLTKNNIGTSRKWSNHGIRNMIKNKIYIGTIVLQKCVNLDLKKTSINNGHAPFYELENEHPPIISKEDFEKANKILSDRSQKSTKEEKLGELSVVISGKVVCKDCGNVMLGSNYRYKEQVYLCTTLGCRKSKVNLNFIKENFIKLRNELVENYEKLLINDNIEDIKYNLEEKQKLNELIKQKEIIYRLKEDKIIDSAIFIEKNNKIDTDIANTQEELYRSRFNNIDRERKKLIKYIKKISETKKIEETFQDNEFNNLIDKIYVKNNTVTYILKTGLKFEYRNHFEVLTIKYGYRKINGKRIINQYEKAVVLYIFNEYIKGATTESIAKALSEQGVKTKRGNITWHKSTVLKYLRTKEYFGNDIYPKLIEEEQFITVQKLLKERRYGNGKKYE